jgi:16S rRNA processing protein RimM
VGRIVRPHGLRGEVVAELVSNRPERRAPGARFQTELGELRLEHARPFGRRWLMCFAAVASRDAAHRLRGVVLRATPLDDQDALWVHELIGAHVVLAGDGRPVSRVGAVVSNPAGDLLELEDGRLVPVRFVVAHNGARVEIDPPEGLLAI